jgi:hypothetical protein
VAPRRVEHDRRLDVVGVLPRPRDELGVIGVEMVVAALYGVATRAARLTAGHLGDTVETLSRTYAHWLRDDRDVPAAALSRMLRPTLTVVETVVGSTA